MDAIIKYPRTPHIQGSRLQKGDEDLSQRPFNDIAGRHIVLEEKIDGANSAISFAEDGELRLQSRGHFLTGGYRERHYDLLKQWAAVHSDALNAVLAEGAFKSTEDIIRYLGDSKYISSEHIAHLREDALKQGLDADRICRETDSSRTMEGIYIKVEEDGKVVDRMKYVRNSFLQTEAAPEGNWLDRAIIPNRIIGTIDDLFAQ